LSPTQQPVQFAELHWDELHAAFVASHVRPEVVQFAHSWPPFPHADGSVPLRQRRLPSSTAQQPVLHDVGLQAGSSRPQTRESSQS
jgi:hypothetical protein